MTKPEFTPEQRDWICWQIGEWYVKWKDRLVNYEDRTHKLGFAKEILKTMICDSEEEITNTLLDILSGLKEIPND